MHLSVLISLAVVLAGMMPFESRTWGAEDDRAERAIHAAEVVGFLDEKLPEIATHLREIKQEDPDEYDEALEHARELVAEYRGIKEELGNQVAATFLKLQRLEWRVDSVAERYHEAATAPERQTARAELREIIEQLFELQLRVEQAELEHARKEVAAFEEELRERREDKDELIVEQLNDLLQADEDEPEDEDEEDVAEHLKEAQLELKSMETRLAELKNELAASPQVRDAATTRTAIAQAAEQIDLQRQLVKLLTELIAARETDSATEEIESALEHIEFMLHIKRQVSEHGEQLTTLRDLKDEAEQAGDVELTKEASELIGLHEQALTTLEQLRKALAGEAEEIHVERQYGRLGYLGELLEVRHEILDLDQQRRAAMERGDRDRVARLEREIKKLRLRAGLEDLDDPAADSDLPSHLEITPDDLAAAADIDFGKQVIPLLEQHCIDCHGVDTQEGELNLVEEVSIRPLVRHGEVWNKVIAHVKNRVMPPEDASEMSDDERRVLASYFEWSVQHFDYSQIDEPGYEGIRRLTHTEYNNTIRDLFGVDLRPADKFPTELSGTSGFDNSGNTLFLHRLLMERYFGAAEEVVERALPKYAKTNAQRQTRAAIFVATADNENSESSSASEIIRRFLLRAYRRPPTDEETASAMRQFQLACQDNQDFDDAIKQVIQTVLVSPHFLMRVEKRQPTNDAYRVSDWDLASRLSYFLWSSMPDTELLDAARQSKLHDAAGLSTQVERMLSDPKSETLGSIFAAQWLGSYHLGVRIRPDPIDNPWCTASLMESLKAETAMFFHSLILNNEPISRLIDADYTFLNEEVAAHYRIDGVQGTHMRRVSLDRSAEFERDRGGIFGQGSLLAITSFPGRTSPVVRGKWILSDVLGTPPPPPPPNVSEFSEEIEDNDLLSPRQKLQQHRRNPNCYSCHSQIDPLGFSLESFDWFGRSRTRSRGRPIDARGKLPNGTEFSGPAGLKKVIIEQRMPDLVRQLTQKMLSYALGRQLEYYDEPAVRRIIKATQNDGYRFRTMVHAIVASYPFQYKKNPMAAKGS